MSKKKIHLDREEKELLESFDNEEWVSLPEKESKKYIEYAKAFNKKDKRINIRLSSQDLEDLQAIAIEEGLPYQTLVSSILHKFVVQRRAA